MILKDHFTGLLPSYGQIWACVSQFFLVRFVYTSKKKIHRPHVATGHSPQGDKQTTWQREASTASLSLAAPQPPETRNSPRGRALSHLPVAALQHRAAVLSQRQPRQHFRLP